MLNAMPARSRVPMALTFLVALSSNLLGFQETTNQDDSKQDQYRSQLLRIVESYELNLAKDKDETPKLLQQPLFSWSNPQRQSDGGALFMWILEGRPVATIGIWKMEAPGRNGFEFQSLATTPVTAENRLLPDWVSAKPAVSYEFIPQAKTPASNERVRLRQMRNIAATRFTAEIDPLVDGGEELRLLDQPLYRYKEKPEGVVDGAVFAFAQDTDPELLLILEARKTDAERAKWHYAVAPSTSHGIRAKFDKRTVLDLQRTFRARQDGAFQLQFWSDEIVQELDQAKSP